MVRGRIETTPSEQLVALRKARDRYAAMADHLNGGTNKTLLEDQQRERDARRFASAYEKSIANMAAKMIRAGAPARTASFLSNLGMARPAFAIAVCLLALVVLVYPGLFHGLRASVRPSAHPPAPPAQTETTPALSSPTADLKADKPSAPNRNGVPGPHHAPTILRPTAVAEQSRPLARPVKPVDTLAKSKSDTDDGFVVKVLQPDGTFKDEHFSSTPR